MREENIAAWVNPPTPRDDLESSLHKISGYFNKLRTVNASNIQDLEKDAVKLRLDKYSTELGESLGVAASKLSKIVDISAFASFVGFLHRVLGPPFTTVVIPKILKSVEATGKVRTTLRVSLDLYISGLLQDLSTVRSALKPVLDPAKSPPHATIKLLTIYKDDLKDFQPILENYATNLEASLEFTPKERNPLLLSEELQKIDEQNRETRENLKAYVNLCEMIDRKPDAKLLSSLLEEEQASQQQSSTSQNTSSTVTSASQTPLTSRPGTPNALRWSSYEHKLTAMATPALVHEAASAFPSDSTIAKKTQALLLEKPRTHMLPYYALFLSLIPSVAERVVPEIVKRSKESQSYLKYTAELVKVGTISPHGGVDVLIRLARPQLLAQQVYTFLEACGYFLADKGEISERITDYMDFLRKQPASTPQERQLIDGALSYLLPTSPTKREVVEDNANLTSFTRILLYRELQKKTFKKILKVLMKLKPTELCSLVPVFLDCSAISGDNIPRVASIIGSLSFSCARFGYQVSDQAIEQFFIDLRGDKRQSIVSQAMLLGNLQVQGMITYDLTELILGKILDTAKDQFRLKLACIFILNCNAGELKSQELMTFLSNYKANVHMDMDLQPIYNDAIAHLQRHESMEIDGSEDEDEDDPVEEEDEEEVLEEDEEEDEEDEVNLEDNDDELDDLEEFSDEDFERQFTMLAGETKPALNEGAPHPVKPLALNFTNLKIAKR